MDGRGYNENRLNPAKYSLEKHDVPDQFLGVYPFAMWSVLVGIGLVAGYRAR